MTDSTTADTQSPALLKVWEDYSAACQAMFERFNGRSSANSGGPIPFEFFGPWKDFAANLGMRTDLSAGEDFKPTEMLAGLLPALGISREYQEIGRRMLELSVQFQRRYAEFAQQGADIGQSALQAFSRRTSNDGSMAMAPAALYDVWIDSAEEAYAGAAHSEPFARLLADLCNILSAFKVERGKLLEALARQLDWPSRAEVDSLHRRVMALTAAAKKAAPLKIRKPIYSKAKVKARKGNDSKAKGSKTKAPKPRDSRTTVHQPPKRGGR
jgi:hypothetical protein